MDLLSSAISAVDFTTVCALTGLYAAVTSVVIWRRANSPPRLYGSRPGTGLIINNRFLQRLLKTAVGYTRSARSLLVCSVDGDLSPGIASALTPADGSVYNLLSTRRISLLTLGGAAWSALNVEGDSKPGRVYALVTLEPRPDSASGDAADTLYSE